MNDHNNSSTAPFWREWPFWIALCLGPSCWWILWLLGVPLRTGSAQWLLLFTGVVLYPVLEEYVFRGGLQAMLYQRWLWANSIVGISLANVLTSAIFAALHLVNQPPAWAAMVFFPSLVFGWMRDRYGHIYASVILHITYNAGFIWLFV